MDEGNIKGFSDDFQEGADEEPAIVQGDVFWIDLGEPDASEPGYVHPYVVVQNNLFNRSRLNTVVVCGITSNLKRAKQPGNVRLKRGEANLPKDCVVNVTQLLTINRGDLTDRIGRLSERRVREVFAGIRLVLDPSESSFE